MPKKILIVDDEPEIVALLEMRLKNEDFKIFTAHDGPHAVETIKSQKPDLVILDVTMPPPNGFQVCRMIKDDKELQHIKIILLTCKSTESDKFWGMESGADAYMTKPFNFPALMKSIQELLKI